MTPTFLLKQTTRREMLRDMLRNSAALAGGSFLAQLFPARLLGAPDLGAPAFGSAQEAAGNDAVNQVRAQRGVLPIQAQKLSDNVTLLMGPGGNVVVLNGPEGKVVVDTFLAGAWPHLKEALDGIGSAPLKYVIDTHWHYDHVDNNAPLHAAGATVIAHENTKKRMSESHDIPLLKLHFDPSPAEALPQQTFAASQKLQANGETLTLQHFAPAHTDTDIYIHFQKANVIHMGDTFFNTMYPFIDPTTGGKVSGMIAAAEKIIGLADSSTKIVPGHGPLGTKADLTKSRELLVTARDRVQKLKSAGKSAEEAVAAKPFADLDAVWGKGILTSDLFAQVVYLSL